MSLRVRMILITTIVVTVLFGVSEWLNYAQTAALLDQHEAILQETADHTVALRKLQDTRAQMFVSTTTMRIWHALGTLIIAVTILNYVWYRVIYRPISRLLYQINIMGRGTWTSALPIKRNDEIGELTMAFNDLGRQLTSTFESINASSKLSALALIGNRLVRGIASVRGQVSGCARSLESSTDPTAAGAAATLSRVDARLAQLESQFEADFDRELSAFSADHNHGSHHQTADSTAGTNSVRKESTQG